MGQDSALRGVVVYYPTQSETAVVPFPWTINCTFQVCQGVSLLFVAVVVVVVGGCGGGGLLALVGSGRGGLLAVC